LKDYPAIDVRTGAPDLLLALVDDFHPSALEDLERDGAVRIFFPSTADRDAAVSALTPGFEVNPVDVPDQDWARRSQEGLGPITVGRVVVAPPWAIPAPAAPVGREPPAVVVVIEPSMGFGTGHHVSTRLCLAALQTIALENQVVLDVGTGSGVLAFAAGLLGAARAVGIDSDPDAIQSACDNIALNPSALRVRFETIDLAAKPLPVVDVVTANLTGALLIRSAAALLAAVRSGGTLVLSGLGTHERDDVCAAFTPAAVVWEREDDGWVGLAMKKS